MLFGFWADILFGAVSSSSHSERADFFQPAVWISTTLLLVFIYLGGGPHHDRLGFRYWVHSDTTSGCIGTGATSRFLGIFSIRQRRRRIRNGTSCSRSRRVQRLHQVYPKGCSKGILAYSIFHVIGAFAVSFDWPEFAAWSLNCKVATGHRRSTTRPSTKNPPSMHQARHPVLCCHRNLAHWTIGINNSVFRRRPSPQLASRGSCDCTSYDLVGDLCGVSSVSTGFLLTTTSRDDPDFKSPLQPYIALFSLCFF